VGLVSHLTRRLPQMFLILLHHPNDIGPRGPYAGQPLDRDAIPLDRTIGIGLEA
jgi:hypothetical protein